MNKAIAVITTAITATTAAVSNKATAAITIAITIITATTAAVSNKATAAKTTVITAQRTKKQILAVTVSTIV